MHYVVPSWGAGGMVFDQDTGQPSFVIQHKIRWMREADCEANDGHNVTHVKGHVNAYAKQFRLETGQVYSFNPVKGWDYCRTNYLSTRSGEAFQCIDRSYQWGSLWSATENGGMCTFSPNGSLYLETMPSQYGIWYRLGVYTLEFGGTSFCTLHWGQNAGTRPYGETWEPEVKYQYHVKKDLRLTYQPVYWPGDDDDPSILLTSEADTIYQDYLEHGSQSDANYSYLCADCCEKISIPHNNTVMNTLDVLRFKPDIQNMFDSWRQFADFHPLLKSGGDISSGQKALKKAKQLSSAYLGTLYGPRLSAKELADIATRERENQSHGTVTAFRNCRLWYPRLEGEGIARVSFSYHYGVYQSVQKTLSNWGLSPITLTDAWDAVPYSFVVDWFVDVSGYLDRSQLRHFMEEIPVSQIWYSEKIPLTGLVENNFFRVAADLTLYYRVERIALGTNLHGYVSPSGGPALEGKGLKISALLIQGV